MSVKWLIWPFSLFLNSVYSKSLRLGLGVLFMVVFSVAQADTRLINISTRAPIQGGAGNIIAGFIIEGTGTQQVVLRGWDLEPGVDSILTLREYPSSNVVATNDNWQDDPRYGEIPSHMVAHFDYLDAALLLDLATGAYTVTLSSVGTKGLGLVGIDAIGDTSAIKLTNISTRAPIQGGAGNVTAGFIIEGTGTQQVVLRGWDLEPGVDAKLTLQKYPSNEIIAINDNWQDDLRYAEIPSHMVGHFDDSDAALLLDLAVGAYTVTLSSVGTKGIGLVGVDAIAGESETPPSSARYTDNSDGTVTDNRSKLVWLKNASCFSKQDWDTATQSAASLASGQCGLSDGSAAGKWRLPTHAEWTAMVDTSYESPALSNAAGTAKWTEGDAFSGVKFDAMNVEWYWSSTSTDGFVSSVFLGDYIVSEDMSFVENFVWPVRDAEGDNKLE